MIAHPFLAARAYDRPLMLEPRRAATLEPILRQHLIHGAPPEKLAGLLNEQKYYEYDDEGYRIRRTELVERVGNVGIIAVEGTLVHKGAWIGSHCGMTSYQGLTSQIAEALADPAIRAVAFEFDTPGGEVSGAFDCADVLAELSAAKETIAICTDMAYSAGYLLASQCRQIVVPASGGVGSIGVITMHLDMSAALAAAGVKVTLITAGAHKADGNPFEALPSDVRDKLAGECEDARLLFADAVGRGRGKRLDRAGALATEADCYSGIDAVSAGLADFTNSPQTAFAAFVERHA